MEPDPLGSAQNAEALKSFAAQLLALDSSLESLVENLQGAQGLLLLLIEFSSAARETIDLSYQSAARRLRLGE